MSSRRLILGQCHCASFVVEPLTHDYLPVVLVSVLTVGDLVHTSELNAFAVLQEASLFGIWKKVSLYRHNGVKVPFEPVTVYLKDG